MKILESLNVIRQKKLTATMRMARKSAEITDSVFWFIIYITRRIAKLFLDPVVCQSAQVVSGLSANTVLV